MRIKFVKHGHGSGALVFCDNDGKEIISVTEVEWFKAIHGSNGTHIEMNVSNMVPVELEVSK
jgi:hypothetical protein